MTGAERRTMPMDFVYTTTAESRPIYHVLYKCSEAQEIEKRNRIKREPPPAEQRLPCPVCLETINDWLKDVEATYS
jgi:hypothetical protein